MALEVMLTGANVIDIAPSKYSIYGRRKVSDAIQEYAMSKIPSSRVHSILNQSCCGLYETSMP